MKTIIAVKDLPKLLRDEVAKVLNVKECTVHIGVNPKVGGNWHDLNRITLVACNTATGVVKTEAGWYGNVGMFATRNEAAINQGFDVILTDANSFVLEFSTYPRGVDVYAHPDAVSKLLPAPEDLTELQKKALYVIKAYISSARYNEARHMGMPRPVFDELKAGLQTKGLLNAAGALTLKGKQVACNLHY